MMEFPRLVYKSASVYTLVEDQKQHDAALSDGWFDSVPEAIAGVHAKEAEQDETSQPTRDELEQKATELGIKFDGRTSDARLLRLINEVV